MPLNASRNEALARREVTDAKNAWPGTKPKTPPNIADAVMARMESRPGEKRVFDRTSLVNFIHNKKLAEEKTPSSYKFDGQTGSAIASLSAEQLTYEIKKDGKTVGVGSLWKTYHDPHSHPKGLRMSPHIFMIDPEKKTQDTLEKCRELAIRDALVLLSLRKKNKKPSHKGLIAAIDDAERRKAVEDGAEELKKQTEYTTHYHGLLARLAPGVSHVVTPAEGLPYVYITTENQHYGKKFYDLSDEGIKKAALFALQHSKSLQDLATLKDKAEKLAKNEITLRQASNNKQYLPHLAFGGTGHASVDIDQTEDDEASPVTHESEDIDEPMEGAAPVSSRAGLMQMPAPLPREDDEDAGAAAERGCQAAKRQRPTPVPAPGVVQKNVVVVCEDVALVPRDRYNAVVAARDNLALEVEELRQRLSRYELVGVETDAFGLGPVDSDVAAWERLRRALGGVPRTYFTRPTEDSLPHLIAVGRAHSQELSYLCGERVHVSFELTPAHYGERVGTCLATKRTLEDHYWRARDSLPDDFVYTDLRDRVHDMAVASRLLHQLVYRRIGRQLPRNDECDAYVCARWRLDFLVIGQMATPAGLVLRPTALHNMWRDMNYLPEIVRYYGVACFTAAAAGIAEPLSHARRKERSGYA